MKKVIFIDSSKTTIFLIENAVSNFENLEIEALFYENSLHFMEYFKNNSCDLIVVAMNLAYMNGIEFIEEIKSINKDIAILILSSENSEKLKNKVKKLGANGWLNKPFTPLSLEKALIKMLGL